MDYPSCAPDISSSTSSSSPASPHRMKLRVTDIFTIFILLLISITNSIWPSLSVSTNHNQRTVLV
uniref:Transmembrane protein n=1 Tax=Megaselia scalaris TaxID=36166 RepID=T1GRU0_MEGSC